MSSKHLSALLLLLLLLPCAQTIHAEGLFDVFGIIREKGENKTINNCFVYVLREDNHIVQYKVDFSGRYNIKLEFDHIYTVFYTASGFYSKKLQFNTHNVKRGDRRFGFEMNTDMALIKTKENQDLRILDSIMGKCEVNNENGMIEWDKEFTYSQIEKIDSVLNSYDKSKKGSYSEYIVNGNISRLDDSYVDELPYVLAIDQDQKIRIFTSNVNGDYELRLPYGSIYRLYFSLSNYVSQNILLYLQIPTNEIGELEVLSIDAELFKKEQGVDYGLFEEPFAIYSYSQQLKKLKANTQYVQAKSKMDSLFIEKYIKN